MAASYTNTLAAAASSGISSAAVKDREDSAAQSLLEIAARGHSASVSVTRPSNTTAYTGGDVIGIADAGTPANAGSAILTFSSIGQTGELIRIVSATLEIDLAANPGAAMTTFRLHLYSTAPAAILDNAAFDLGSTAADRAKYLGWVDFDPLVDLGSTLYFNEDNINKLVKLAASSTSLYGVLQTGAGYTPSSGDVHVVRLNCETV